MLLRQAFSRTFTATASYAFQRHSSNFPPRVCSIRARAMLSSHAQAGTTCDDDYSLDNLHTRMQDFIKQHSGNVQFALALAGGGSHFLSTLTSTPGASAVLLEGAVTYDRESFKDYVETNQERLFQFDGNHDRNPSFQDITSSGDFLYVSHQASQLLGSAALRRASYLAARGVDPTPPNSNASPSSSSNPATLTRMRQTVGVAMTSKLRSNQSGTSRAFAIVTRHDGLPVSAEATLVGGRGTTTSSNNNHTLEHSDGQKPRTRLQEDVFVSHVLLTCLEEALSDNHPTSAASDTQKFTTHMGDQLELCVPPKFSFDEALANAINRILLQEQRCVMLIPEPVDGEIQWRPLATPILPASSLIVSGSFNPPHTGHVGLAQAALDATQCPVAWFELALTNADKQNEWTVDKVMERLEGFSSLSELQSQPFQWGVMLTSRAPLFADKAYLLDPLQANPRDGPQQLCFVIGTDTLVRMVDPKYYGDSVETMLETLAQMPCRFVVGGRLKQSKNPDDNKLEFVSGKEEVASLPSELQSKFVLLPDFRMDISSTELRKKLAEKPN